MNQQRKPFDLLAHAVGAPCPENGFENLADTFPTLGAQELGHYLEYELARAWVVKTYQESPRAMRPEAGE